MLEIVGDLALDPVRIDGDDVILGRGPASDIVLEDPRVSRQHARLWIDEHRMMVEDLGSKAGTVVNGQPVSGSVELRTGDHLRLGLTELAVVWQPGAAGTLEMPVVQTGETGRPDEPVAAAPPASDEREEASGYRTYFGVATIDAGAVSRLRDNTLPPAVETPAPRASAPVIPAPARHRRPMHPVGGAGALEHPQPDEPAEPRRRGGWLRRLIARLRRRPS